MLNLAQLFTKAWDNLCVVANDSVIAVLEDQGVRIIVYGHDGFGSTDSDHMIERASHSDGDVESRSDRFPRKAYL